MLPDGFLFGVATAGFQVEGGYNGHGQPANNWAEWERSGRVERSGVAIRFWDDYEHHLDRAVAAGCTSFRLSVEWARCEPAEGEIDDDAFARYDDILRACQERGLEPLVTLLHFTHPAWLGPDLWLDFAAPARFAAWAELAVTRLGSRCRRWVTLNEVNVLALHTYLTGMFPPGGRFATGSVVRALDHLLTAHVLGYEAVRRAQPDAVIATNNYGLTTYELDRLLVDLLLTRHLGAPRSDLRRWLVERRARWYSSLPTPSPFERVVRRASASVIPLEQAFPRAIAAIYESPHERTLDSIQLDYYDPVASHHLRLPGHRTAGGRSWLPGRMLWDDPPDPPGLTRWVRANAEPGLPVEIVENGMCNRVLHGRSLPRLDGWDRPRYLRENLAAVGDAVGEGLPVTGYWHWTLADNYEWGSYEPRFGLYGIDRGAGIAWSELDSLGHDSAGEYRRTIEAMR